MPLRGTPEQKKKQVFAEYKAGSLHSGRGGPVVKDKRQAIAIALATERRKGKAKGGAVR
jgi:hypothetical protein